MGNAALILSVPEILQDTMDAFKASLPVLNAFSTDFSSKTAVKGDKITAHVSTLPAVQDYDSTNGFNNSPAAAESLIQNVSVTMSSFKHVPVKITWLQQLSSKKALYREAVRNYGYVLAKQVLDDALATITSTNFFNSKTCATANVTLDSIEEFRTQLNSQKAANVGRFGIASSLFAAALQNDDRVKSSLFYAQLNGNEGYRHFRNLAGFENIWEYPDFPTTGNLSAFFGDRRAIVLANRRLDFSNAAAELNVPQVMQFYPISDPETGLEMTGVAWQQPGTGDVYVSCGVLYGVNAGAGVPGDSPTVAGRGTDLAGLRIVTA